MSTLSLKNTPPVTMTLEQQRAQKAWSYAQEGVARSEQYKDLAKATPALIMNNGLMQTLAFFEDKGKDHHQLLAKHLRCWLMSRAGGSDKDPGFNTFMEILLKADSAQYRQASEEALLLLRWLRQFAAAAGGEK